MHMSLKSIIQEIIIEHQNLPPEEIVRRDIQIERIPRKATVLLGIRRCGKTTLMRQREKELLAAGVDKKAICFIDFYDDRLAELRNGEPGIIAEAYYSLFPEMENEKVYFFFDEIQNLNNWERFVNRLMNTRVCEVNITGSSARLLEKEASTEMGGRKLSWHLLPYSFAEFLRGRNIPAEIPHTQGGRARLAGEFGAYMARGGFPESQMFSSDSVAMKYLQDTANDIVFRDIIERYSVSNANAVKIMMLVLASQLSSRLSITKLYQRLRGMQLRISREAAGEYLSYFEDAFFVYLVPIRSYNLAVRNTNDKKVYLADHSFAKALSPQSHSSWLLLENIVFLHLLRRFGEEGVAYYRTSGGYEVDFACGPDDDILLVQAAWSLDDEDTREREVRALEEAMRELGVHEAFIVTGEESCDIQADSGCIHVVPAWDYLLFR